MTDELLRYRSEFPILERTTYLISNSLGAMPRGVYDAMKGYADIWATRGVRAWEERWWMLCAEVGDEIGAIMNAPKGSVSTHQNVTTCQAVVASCFDFSGKRNKVVYSDLNFPSVMYFWEAQRRYGARVHMVKTDDGVTVPIERLLDAIDENTLLAPVSHVIFRSAYINDAKAIVEKAHRGTRSARYVSVTRHCSRGRAISERRLRVRGRSEMALWRARRRISLRSSRSREETRTKIHRLVRA
jgi:kynureninase